MHRTSAAAAPASTEPISRFTDFSGTPVGEIPVRNALPVAFNVSKELCDILLFHGYPLQDLLTKTGAPDKGRHATALRAFLFPVGLGAKQPFLFVTIILDISQMDCIISNNKTSLDMSCQISHMPTD